MDTCEWTDLSLKGENDCLNSFSKLADHVVDEQNSSEETKNIGKEKVIYVKNKMQVGKMSMKYRKLYNNIRYWN